MGSGRIERIDHVGAIRPDRVATEVTSFKSHNLYAESFRAPGGTFAVLKKNIDALAGLRQKRHPLGRSSFFEITRADENLVHDSRLATRT